MTARLILGLLQEERNVKVSGSIHFVAKEITAAGAFVREARGKALTMILQDPSSALNPTFTILDQFHEVLRRAAPTLSRAAACVRATQWLKDMLLRGPARVLSSYVFQPSVGMSQRVLIAMALANERALLMADEPGTALDVSVRAQAFKLMKELTTRLSAAVRPISHNLGVVREFADRVYVIYRWRIVEHGRVAQIFPCPLHPYACALLSAAPRNQKPSCPISPNSARNFFCRASIIQTASNPLTRPSHECAFAFDQVGRKDLRCGRTPRPRLDAVTHEIVAGERYVIVGESGSGKTTQANIIFGTLAATEGLLRWKDDPLPGRRR